MIIDPLMLFTSSTVSVQKFLLKLGVSLARKLPNYSETSPTGLRNQRNRSKDLPALSWNKSVLYVKIVIDRHPAVDGYRFSQRDMTFKRDCTYCWECGTHCSGKSLAIFMENRRLDWWTCRLLRRQTRNQQNAWKDQLPGDLRLTEAFLRSHSGPLCWCGTAW